MILQIIGRWVKVRQLKDDGDENWIDYSSENFPIREFRNITKFDLLSSSISISNNVKTYIDNETLNWLRFAERSNKIPQNFQKKLVLSIPFKSNKKKSFRNFNDKKILYSEFSNLLYKTYGYDKINNTRGYGSGGALYPVNTILFILKDNVVDKIENGIYYYYPLDNSLYKLCSLENINDRTLKLALYPSKTKPDSNIVIGYAVDLRKVVRKYKYLGYKNALIEIGLMAQALKENLPSYMGEYSCQDFNNRLLTKLANLDVQNSPIEMIQWIGGIDNE